MQRILYPLLASIGPGLDAAQEKRRSVLATPIHLKVFRPAADRSRLDCNISAGFPDRLIGRRRPGRLSSLPGAVLGPGCNPGPWRRSRRAVRGPHCLVHRWGRRGRRRRCLRMAGSRYPRRSRPARTQHKRICGCHSDNFPRLNEKLDRVGFRSRSAATSSPADGRWPAPSRAGISDSPCLGFRLKLGEWLWQRIQCPGHHWSTIDIIFSCNIVPTVSQGKLCGRWIFLP